MKYLHATFAFVIDELDKAYTVFKEQTLVQNVLTIILLYLFGAVLPVIALIALLARFKSRF